MRCATFVLLALFCLCCFADMDKVLLSNTNETGAVCIDGSPGVYFFKEGSEANKTKWVFHLLGGGMCMSDEECVMRYHHPLGTSTLWPDKYQYDGPISDDPEYNPDFYDWNHAFFVYCDGASFSSDKTDPVTVGDYTMYYRGHRILLEIIKDLTQNKGLDTATDVLIVGDSAGAMATYYHVEEIKSLMPSSVTRFKAAPFSGVFLDRPNVINHTFFRDILAGVIEHENCSGTLNTRCLEANPDETWKCFFAEYLLDHIDTPLFVINSADDAIGVFCIALGEPLLGISNGTGNCSAVPGWEDCELGMQCTDEQWSKIGEYAAGFREIFENHPKMLQDGNGLYEYDCYTHSIEAGYGWDHLVVQNVTLRDAVRAWFFSDNEPASEHTYKDCHIEGAKRCNPTCAKPVPPPSSSSGYSSGSGSSSDEDSSSLLNPMMSVICAAFIAIYHLVF